MHWFSMKIKLLMIFTQKGDKNNNLQYSLGKKMVSTLLKKENFFQQHFLDNFIYKGLCCYITIL